MRPSSLVATSLLLAVACRGGPWTPPPHLVSCVAPLGTPVPGATVTFHPPIAEDGDAVVVLARGPGLIGSATMNPDERDRPVTVHVRSTLPTRGHVRTPPGYAGPVLVSVVTMQALFVPRGLDRCQVQGFRRTWSMGQHAWLPRIEALDVESRADGSFELEACCDAVELAFTAPGLASVRRWAPAGAALEVEMVPEARIAVNVVDPGGEPVGGTHVRLATFASAAAATADGELLTWERRTGADGSASFDGLPAGAYVVTVAAPELALHVARTTVAAGRSVAIAARLERGVLLRGTVRDANGKAVAGARVSAALDMQPPFPAGTARVDANGDYRLRLPRCAVALRLADLPGGWRDPDDSRLLDLSAAGRWAVADFALERDLPAAQAQR
jgi:hypothetical protein